MSRRLTMSALCIFYAGMARADEAPVKALFQFSLFDLTKSRLITSTQSQETDRSFLDAKTSALADSLLALSYDNFSLYLYPFQDSNAFVSFGYLVRDDLELGVDIGYNREVLRQDTLTSDSKDTLLGAYAIHFLNFSTFTLESNIIYDRIQSVAPIETPEDPSTKTDSFFAKLSFTAVWPLRSNSFLISGVSYTNSKQKTGTSETSLARTGIQVAGLRFTL